MHAFQFSFLAAATAASVNFLFRKSSEASEKTNFNYYLLFLYFISFIISIMISFKDILSQFNPIIFAVGCCVGLLNMAMMWLTAQALLTGPAGLTFAFQNASGIFPGLILFFAFGPMFGFELSVMQVAGMLMVLCGLYLGSKQTTSNQKSSRLWFVYAIGCFLIQILAFCIICWRCLLFNLEAPFHDLIPWKLSASSDAWFLPGQFGTAFILQLFLIVAYDRRRVSFKEFFYGSSGGILNAVSSFFLLLATKVAMPFEKALIFPSFVVMTMIFCNLWANRFYQERFNWTSNCLCSLGIFLGSII